MIPVITRSKSESIVIGRDIVLTVLEVRDDHVLLGNQAPQETDIRRVEPDLARVASEFVVSGRSAADRAHSFPGPDAA